MLLLSVLLGCHPPGEGPPGPGRDSADSAPDPPPDSGDSASDTADPADDTGTAPTPPDRVRVGAIRWDAWQEDGEVNAVVEATLGPAHWHDRMPFFGEETGADAVSIRGNDPATMAEEVAYAAAAGVDWWAFVTYPPDLGMTHALDLYLDGGAADVGFSLVLQGSWLAYPGDAEWPGQVDRYVGLFADPRFVRVLDGRPLLFLFDAASMWGTSRFPDEAAAAGAFAELREASLAAGQGDPYLVLMGWDPAADAATAGSLGFDALSAYAVAGGTAEGAAYAELTAQAAAGWEAQAATGVPVVPLLGAGWDPRPRIETPTPWATYGDAWFETPGADALAAHVLDGVQWVEAHPDAAPAGAVIVYAWNEHDEGGWLCPTWTAAGPDTSRVDALAAAIAARTEAAALVNGGFEAPPVDGGWYVVPADGLPAAFAWETGVGPGTYLLADPRAAHFAAAAEGRQALLLSSARELSQAVTAAESGTATLSWSLLTGTYPGDTVGTVEVALVVDRAVVAVTTVSTPATPGTWEAHTLSVPVEAGSSVVARFRSTGGMPWLDAVGLGIGR